MPGFEILQVGVFGESLSGAGLPQRCDGLGIGNLHSERQTVMQRYLSIKQRDRLGWRQPSPEKTSSAWLFNSGSTRARIISVLAIWASPCLVLLTMYHKRGTY